jgi:hypothetical protein
MTPAAVNSLANTFIAKCAEKVMSDERYAEMMMELVPEFITELTGLEDVEDITEVAMLVMDNLILKVSIL